MVVGGGRLSRFMNERITGYIQKEESQHNVAMLITQTNAAIVRGFINSPELFFPNDLGEVYEYLMDKGKKHMISGGLKVGWSTDMDAAVFADMAGVDRVYKISDIDHVYTSDPKEDVNAEPINEMTWEDYFKQFNVSEGSTHLPNQHIPVSTAAAQFSREKGISFFVSGGKNIEESKDLREVFESGTFIHP